MRILLQNSVVKAKVTIHYVGKVTGSDAELDSTRQRGEAFTCTLGKGELVKGLELGVPTMRKGELAQFTLAPEFGPQGPAVPDGATASYEVELLSWRARTDLFEDGSVIKTAMEEGSGWKMPRLKEEVCMSVRMENSGGGALKELKDVEYTLGSKMFGDASTVVDKCLIGMKRQEVALLQCKESLDFSEGLLADQVTLTLNEIYEIKDVSFKKDSSLMKKQILQGEGYDTPKDSRTAWEKVRILQYLQRSQRSRDAKDSLLRKIEQVVIHSVHVCIYVGIHLSSYTVYCRGCKAKGTKYCRQERFQTVN